MTLFLIRLADRSDPEAFLGKQFSSNQQSSGQEVERPPQQVLEHLREVRANYSLERHLFF